MRHDYTRKKATKAFKSGTFEIHTPMNVVMLPLDDQDAEVGTICWRSGRRPLNCGAEQSNQKPYPRLCNGF